MNDSIGKSLNVIVTCRQFTVVLSFFTGQVSVRMNNALYFFMFFFFYFSNSFLNTEIVVSGL